MSGVLEQVGKAGLMPVIEIGNPEQAVPLAEALLEAGLPVAEFTFRTDAAAASIRAVAREVEDILVGAGTVLSVDQVKTAVDAGARFIVSPGFNPKVVGYCVEQGIPITPGVNNPTGVELALDMGVRVVKFFPAEATGGVKFLKAMAAPFGDKVRYVPTGGVSPDNLGDYLAMPQVLACGGSWMVPGKRLAAGAFDEIKGLVREAVALAARLRGGNN